MMIKGTTDGMTTSDREEEGTEEGGGGEILAAWKLEANPNPSNPKMDPT